MGYVKLLRKVREINTGIRQISDFGLKPVTLKSVSDISRVVIAEKGTGEEGRILSFSEVNERLIRNNEKPLTRNAYNNYVNDLVESVGSQLTFDGALDYAYELGIARLTTWASRDSDNKWLFEELQTLSKEEIVKLLIDSGEYANEREDNGYNSASSFFDRLFLGYTMLEEERESRSGENL